MIIATLKTLYKRDLNRFMLEIEAYKNEDKIWAISPNISNSAGNLCLHLIGNLNTYIGAQFGNTGYIRDRENEFLLKNVPRADLIHQIKETIKIIEDSLDNVSEQELDAEYPILVFDTKTTTGYFLIHLATHLTYHLGQVNYHRRLLDK
jgi:uncharacterized damage-inducible protein DinB